MSFDKKAVDKIAVNGLSVYARIGATSDERATPQQVKISIELYFDIRPAAKSDALEDTVCYESIKQIAIKCADSREWVLAESLAEKLAASMLEGFEIVEQVKVKLNKFFLSGADSTEVGIVRSRA